MQRVVQKRSVVSKLQTDHYGFRLAFVDRWPLFGGGRQDRFDCTCICQKVNIALKSNLVKVANLTIKRRESRVTIFGLDLFDTKTKTVETRSWLSLGCGLDCFILQFKFDVYLGAIHQLTSGGILQQHICQWYESINTTWSFRRSSRPRRRKSDDGCCLQKLQLYID